MKDPRWKQRTPIDQLITLQCSMRGDFENWEEKIISTERFATYMEDHLFQLSLLTPYLNTPEKWTD